MDRVFAFLKILCFFVLGLFLTSALIGLAVANYAPEKPTGLIGEKIAYLQENKFKENVIFLGTSQTFRNINPTLFEKKAKQNGCSFQSYNAGVPGLTLEELQRFLKVIQETKSNNQKRFVVFHDPLPPKPSLKTIKNTRTQAHSSLTDFKYRVQNVWSLHEPFWKKTVLSGVVGLSQIYSFFNIGDISNWIFPEIYAEQSALFENTPTQKGYPSLTYDIKHDETIAKRYTHFQNKKDVWAKNVLEPQRSVVDVRDLNINYEKRVAILSGVAQKIIDMGDVPVFIVHPEPETLAIDQQLARDFQKANPNVATISFANPQKHPQLWNTSVWFDKTHLNENGAEILSSAMARNICDYKKKGVR